MCFYSFADNLRSIPQEAKPLDVLVIIVGILGAVICIGLIGCRVWLSVKSCQDRRRRRGDFDSYSLHCCGKSCTVCGGIQSQEDDTESMSDVALQQALKPD